VAATVSVDDWTIVAYTGVTTVQQVRTVQVQTIPGERSEIRRVGRGSTRDGSGSPQILDLAAGTTAWAQIGKVTVPAARRIRSQSIR
jgi:hypothetical protein